MLFAVPSQVGYAVLAALIFGESAGLPIPGETALIVAGGLSAGGHLSLPLVIAIATVAAIVGDTLGYWLGRRGGRAFLTRDGFGASHRRRALAHADKHFARHGAITVFVGRWIPGLRYMAALVAGATRMPWRRFALANAAGALVWASAVATLARLAGPVGSLAFSVGGLALGAAMLLVSRRRQRREHERHERQRRQQRRVQSPRALPLLES
jgi:membrane protein DedA with SNARE-associated domain